MPVIIWIFYSKAIGSKIYITSIRNRIKGICKKDLTILATNYCFHRHVYGFLNWKALLHFRFSPVSSLNSLYIDNCIATHKN